MAVFLSPVGGVAAQFFTNSGVPLTGGKLYTYAAGTTTPLASYTTSAGGTARTNPIILDSAGRVGDGGEIWLTQNVVYKFVLKDSNDVLIGTYDNVSGISDITLPISSSSVTYLPAGTGAVATTVQAKLRQTVSVLDFMTSAQIADVQSGVTPVIDVTSCFVAAQAAAKNIQVPTGRYLVDNLRIQSKVVFECDGYLNTFFYQASTGNNAINVLSDVTTGQLDSISLCGFSIVPKAGATVAALRIAAFGVYAVGQSKFDYKVDGSFRALEINCTPSRNNVALCNIKVIAFGSTSTTVYIDGGVYNELDLLLNVPQNGISVESADLSCVYKRIAVEGQLYFRGQNQLLLNPAVEQLTGASLGSQAAIRLEGFNQTLINPIVILDATSAAKCGAAYSNFANSTFISPNIIAPTLAKSFSVAVSPMTLIGPVRSDVIAKMEATEDISLVSFIGDCTEVTDSLNGNFKIVTISQTLTSSGNITSALASDVIVSTSATTIFTRPSLNGTTNTPGLYVVTGQNGADGGGAFADVITLVGSRSSLAVVVISSNNSAVGASARTYSVSGANIKLAMASGTYKVSAGGFAVQASQL